MSSAVNRVVTNTGILYGKMIFTVGISLYTTRVILDALGAVDFGIYNLVAGVITMLSFLNAAMTTSTQRYLSFSQGTNNEKALKEIFSNSLFLHICLAILIILLIELAGVFLFSNLLNIPADRIGVAKIIFHFMALSVGFSIISVPFVASINAHEDMIWIAVVNIIEVLLKLGIALMLLFKLIDYDNLILYGVGVSIVSFIVLIFYGIFCLAQYKECSLFLFGKIKKNILSELSTFAGWNLFGALCGVGRSQGLAVILNLFFGTVINAAYGIANQVSGQMTFFSATMLRALNPQIMKSEGAGNRKRMLSLSMMASKYGFFLLAIVAIPAIFEMNSILGIWLKKVPEASPVFTRLILIGIMLNQTTIGLQSAVQATGRIKVYQAIVGTLLLLNIPIAYILLKIGFASYIVLYSYIIIEVMACFCRLKFIQKIAYMSLKEYFCKVYARIFFPTLLNILVCIFSVNYFQTDFRLLITISISVLVFGVSVYLFGMEKYEKDYLKRMIYKKYAKRVY